MPTVFARLVSALGCIALVVGMIVGMAACSSIAPSPPRQAAAGEHSVSGRISVRYKDASSGREDAFHGRFDWLQTGRTIEITLLDPLGQSVALLKTDPAAATSTLTLRDGRTFTGRSPEDLTEQTLGWRLPASGLGYWLDGRPAPGSPAEIEANTHAGADTGSGPSGTPRRLVQDGWTVRYPDSSALVPPKRIDLSYAGGGGEIELRLAIDGREPVQP